MFKHPVDILDEFLRPEINKLRFIRELAIDGGNKDISGLTDEPEGAVFRWLVPNSL